MRDQADDASLDRQSAAGGASRLLILAGIAAVTGAVLVVALTDGPVGAYVSAAVFLGVAVSVVGGDQLAGVLFTAFAAVLVADEQGWTAVGWIAVTVVIVAGGITLYRLVVTHERV